MSISKSSIAGQNTDIGKVWGPSKYILITQKMINQFSEATHDLDPMHIDPEWSEKHSPYKTTISFGFLTMSLMTSFAHDLLHYDREDRVGGRGFPLNYGFNKLRFISPVPVNSRVSATLTLLSKEERAPDQTLSLYHVTLNIEGQKKPALVGEWLTLWVSE